MLNHCDKIIHDQSKKGVVEIAQQDTQATGFYLVYRPAICENVESTNVWILYSGSTKLSNSTIIGYCYKKIWCILLRNRFKTIVLSADMKKVFLQFEIGGSDRDWLQFH